MTGCRWTATAAAVMAVGLLVRAVPAVAHHAAAEAYDASKKVEAQGTIARVLLRNPHSFVFLDAMDEKGQKIEWQVEMGSVAQMLVQGWTKEMLTPGMVVRVVGIPSRAPGSHGITNATFSRPDGSPIGPPSRSGQGD
jgi:Family of unknown function (DUF6152)